MSQGPVVKVFTPGGRFVGQFVNPTISMDPEHYYTISGEFVDEQGHPFERAELNPEVLPYKVDISTGKKCNHGELVHGYIQRGRQPVVLTANCQLT